MNEQSITFCENLEEELLRALQIYRPDKLFVLVDGQTRRCCLPLIHNIRNKAEIICIKAGDKYKTLQTLSEVWQVLSNKDATRNSLLLNLGGGMITDLGGFAAATFKRGIRYINVPTTLLAMVDASVGGKTGINFNGLKNEIGAFAPAQNVFIYPEFLKTLDTENFLSGYAEMLKHGLISTPENWADLLNFNLKEINYPKLRSLIRPSIQIKEEIVKQDPFEQNLRKALNLGHTVGHAFESLALSQNRPVLHGYAVTWGIACELYLSHIQTGFPLNELRQTIRFIKDNYGTFFIDCHSYEQLYSLMKHDKKNASADTINFTLLKDIGHIQLNQTAGKEEIFEMLDFYRECMGI